MNVGVVKKNRLVLRDTMTLRVGSDWIADRDTVSVINSGDRNESLQLITSIDLASDIHRAPRQAKEASCHCPSRTTRPKYADRRRIIELDDTVWPVDAKCSHSLRSSHGKGRKSRLR